MTTSLDDFVSARDAAEIAKVDVSTISRWAKGGRIRAQKVGGGRRSPYVIARSDIKRVAAERADQLAARAEAMRLAGAR